MIVTYLLLLFWSWFLINLIWKFYFPEAEVTHAGTLAFKPLNTNT